MITNKLQVQTNPLIERLPKHLKQFIKPQNYEEYTPINQSVWRYVMRKNVNYLSKVAHESYMKGLEKTGISIEHIPSMYGMNRILKEIGWAAVAVDGFIPPNAFMEFQAYNVLVIASDIRQLENIEYTPAPDIIHEGAGHAPIIANAEYAEYLRRFGAIGSKAISSAHDYEIYEAIRTLSIVEEAEGTPQDVLEQAREKVNQLQAVDTEPSEMALIRNLHWWTVEYGLSGTLENPKIYGAGLLSSIGESEWCMTDKVKKLPYDISAAYQGFDITKPQPQLFVTPDFAFLNKVLEEFANTMALRVGGLKGVRKLIDSKAMGTIELSTGLQVSGVFSNTIEFNNQPIYIQTSGPTALAFREKELVNHGSDYHAEGFGSPIGKLKGVSLAIEDMTPRDLEAYGIFEGKRTTLEFEGGVVVDGEVITGIRNLQGKIIVVQFKDCKVTHNDIVLFDPSWGVYDMAVGKEIVSAFSGPADVNSFDMITHVPNTNTIKAQSSKKKIKLEHLYKQVRDSRENNTPLNFIDLLNELKQDHTEDWLLTLELYELATKRKSEDKEQIFKHLLEVKSQRKEIAHLINNGINLIN